MLSIPLFLPDSLIPPHASSFSPLKVTASLKQDAMYNQKISFSSLFEQKDPEEALVENALRVISFNIRSDDDPGHAWCHRKQKVASVLRFHHADLIGLQEPSEQQLHDLCTSLTEFEIYGGVCLKEGAHDPIFFRKSRFQLLHAGYFYLSQTPDFPSTGWDAKYMRATCWVKLLDKRTRKQFYFFNTHFDYHGRVARDESARLLKQKIREIAGRFPFVLTGDFNLFPTLGGEETYQILTDQTGPIHLTDAQTISQHPHHGPTGTWSGFKEAGQPGIKPDYIFVGPQIEVYLHGVLADTFDGQFPSDHLPVLADVLLS